MCIILFSASRISLGDVNNDGEIDVLDIVRIVNIITENGPPPSEEEFWTSDVNVDGTTNVQDIVIIVQVIMENDDCPDLYSPCSENLSLCCMDTTNHNFDWDIQLFGAPSGNINSLYDAHIISDDDIWVVGEIREFDGDTLHNYLHWDGLEWTRGKMREDNNTSPYPHILYSVFGFTENDLWVTLSLPSHYNGDSWYMYLPDDDGFPSGLGGIHQTWGTSSENMYFSKHSGDIIHWNGNEFSIMETTTGSGDQYNPQFPIWDMFGLDDNHIWTICGYLYELSPAHPRKLSYYNGEVWTDLYEFTNSQHEPDELNGWIYNVWAYGDTVYVSAAYEGVWRESITTGEGSYMPLDSLEYELALNTKGRGIAGNNPNDIFTVSVWGKYAHFNGSTCENSR